MELQYVKQISTIEELHPIFGQVKSIKDLQTIFSSLGSVTRIDTSFDLFGYMNDIFTIIKNISWDNGQPKSTIYLQKWASACSTANMWAIKRIVSKQMGDFYKSSGHPISFAKEWYIRADERGHRTALIDLFRLEKAAGQLDIAIVHGSQIYEKMGNQTPSEIYFEMAVCSKKLGKTNMMLHYVDLAKKTGYNQYEIDQLTQTVNTPNSFEVAPKKRKYSDEKIDAIQIVDAPKKRKCFDEKISASQENPMENYRLQIMREKINKINQIKGDELRKKSLNDRLEVGGCMFIVNPSTNTLCTNMAIMGGIGCAIHNEYLKRECCEDTKIHIYH
jgi:hypothetical protein